MMKYLLILTVGVILLGSPVYTIYASDSALRVGIPKFPPYYDIDTKSGIFNRLLTEVFSQAGFNNIEYVMTSHKRRSLLFEAEQIDVGINMTSPTKIDHYELKELKYEPAFITLGNTPDIDGPEGLDNLIVGSFSGARNVFGQKFREQVDRSNYTEVTKTSLIPRMLQLGRFDVIVMDKYVFLSLLKERENENQTNQEYSFSPLSYGGKVFIHFHDKSVYTAIKKAFEAMRLDGRYDRIFQAAIEARGLSLID